MVLAADALANESQDHFLPYPLPLDGVGASAEKGKLYVVVTGTSAFALVYYSPA